jgi:hypothetical protein
VRHVAWRDAALVNARQGGRQLPGEGAALARNLGRLRDGRAVDKIRDKARNGEDHAGLVREPRARYRHPRGLQEPEQFVLVRSRLRIGAQVGGAVLSEYDRVRAPIWPHRIDASDARRYAAREGGCPGERQAWVDFEEQAPERGLVRLVGGDHPPIMPGRSS